MYPSAELLTTLVCSLLIVSSALDFSGNTHDTDTNADGDSPTGSSGPANGGNEGMTFNFGNASTSWEPADRAPIAQADNVVPAMYYGDYGLTDENDTAAAYPDFSNGDDNPDYYDYDYGDPNDGGSDSCEGICMYACLSMNECYEPQCANFSCDYYHDDYYDEPPPTNNNGNGTTLRPISERQCKQNSALYCIHGICADGDHCSCDKGWTQIACNYPCTKKCDHGNCMINPAVLTSGKPPKDITEEDMFCNCEHDYYKDECKDPVPDKVAMAEEEGRKLAIILGSCLTVAVLASIILPIVLWRKRVIFVMKVVYFFKMWEDNDGKTHDAYISAGTTGRALKFVKSVLAPKLEQQGFKLFIPSRDQLCGAVISEEIITAIKQSRRTIMVVTPEYLQNDWSGFEVLNAQVEMIKLQQRIIPVILEDVSKETPEMRKSLKHILESVKCLKVPGYKSAFIDFHENSGSKKKVDKFWRRLELTMPKKRQRISSDENSCYTQNDLSEQQNMSYDNYSKSVPDSKPHTFRGQTYDSIEVNIGDFHTKSYDTMTDSMINPFSVYQINSHNQEIDISRYEQCFNFKTTL